MHIPLQVTHTNPPPPTNQTMNSSLPILFNPYPDLDPATLTKIKIFAYIFLILAMLLGSLGGWMIKRYHLSGIKEWRCEESAKLRAVSQASGSRTRARTSALAGEREPLLALEVDLDVDLENGEQDGELIVCGYGSRRVRGDGQSQQRMSSYGTFETRDGNGKADAVVGVGDV